MVRLNIFSYGKKRQFDGRMRNNEYLCARIYKVRYDKD